MKVKVLSDKLVRSGGEYHAVGDTVEMDDSDAAFHIGIGTVEEVVKATSNKPKEA